MSPCYPFNTMSKSQRSQGHKVQKHISGDQVAGVSLHSVEWPASSFTLDNINCFGTILWPHSAGESITDLCRGSD